MSFRSKIFGLSLLVLAGITSVGCASEEADEESGEDEGALENSGKPIATSQRDLTLYQGYNTVLDQGHGGCITFGNDLVPKVGGVGVDTRITHVKSREDLARELGFDADLGFKLPKTGVDARAQVMNSFKRSSSSTTLLVRIGSYYWVDAGQNYKLTADANALLQRDPRGFLQKCGDAIVTGLQFRAEVLGLMTFQTNDQEKGTKAAASADVKAPSLGSVAEASAKVGGSINQMKSSGQSNMNIELFTQGFTPPPEAMQGIGRPDADILGSLQKVLEKMGETVKGDRDRDFTAAAEGKLPFMRGGETAAAEGAPRRVIQRSAVLGAMTYHAYAKNEEGGFASIARSQNETKGFLATVGDVQSKLESAYYEEVNAFIRATDQEAYNHSVTPKATSIELEGEAQKWAKLLSPRPGDNSITSRFSATTLECVRLAIAGDQSACKRTDATNKLIKEGNDLLDQYNREGRIVRMNIVYGSPGAVVVDEATAACTKSNGRLPKDSEMNWLKPALSAKGGAVWVTSDKCPKQVGIYTGSGQPTCYEGWYMDSYDRLLDATGLSKRAAPVFCVGNNGPRVVLPPAGQ